MARDAMGKLAEADDLDRTASRIAKKDAQSARELRQLARSKRHSAIKQMRRRPKRRENTALRGA